MSTVTPNATLTKAQRALVDKALDLAGEYFDIGVAEGREGRRVDDQHNSANNALHALRLQLEQLVTHVPKGYKLIAREPTDQMRWAALEAPAYGHPETAVPTFAAQFDAAWDNAPTV